MINSFTLLTIVDYFKIIAISVVVLLLQQFSTEFLTTTTVPGTFVLGTGFALAIVLLTDSRYLFGVFAGLFIANLLNHQPLSISAALGAVNSFGVFWGVWLLTRAKQAEFNLRSLPDFFQLLFYGAVCASGLSALLSTGVWIIAGKLTFESCLPCLLYWWMGNGFSVALITPFILAWAGRSSYLNQTRRQKILLLALVGFILISGQWVYGIWISDNAIQPARAYWLFPLVVWMALRADIRISTLVLTVISIQGIAGIYLNQGLFNYGDSLQNRLLDYWFYHTTLIVLGLTLTLHANQCKRIESNLMDSQNRYKTLVNNSSILVWICGLNKRCFYFNQVWLDFTGKTLEQEMGDGWLDGIHQDDLRHYLDLFMTAFDAQEPFQIEYRLACADGSYHWMLDHGAPRFNDQGKFLGFIGTLVDISSRKVAEQSLGFRTKELTLQNKLLKQISSGISKTKLLTELVRQMEILLPGSVCSIMLLDQDEHCLLTGAAVSLPGFYLDAINGLIIGEGRGSCGTAAYRGERVIIDNISEHAYWADFKAVSAAIGIETCWSQPIVTQSGRVLGTLAIHYKQPKQPSTAEWALIERYSSLAQLTIEHKQYEDAIEESEERLRFVLEGSELGFWDWQIKQNLVKRNAIWADILGYKHYEIKNTVQFWLDLVYVDDKDRAWQSVKDVLNGQTNIHEIEYRMYHKDGSLRWIHDHAKVVQRDSNGFPIRMSGTHNDITKIKQSEEELRIAAIAFDCQEGMYVTNTSKVILRINQAFTKITGFTEADTLGRTPKLFQSGIQTVEFYKDMWGHIHSTGEWRGEIWNCRKDGAVFPAWLTVTAVKGNNKEITHYVATITDITSRKMAEEKIARLAFYDALTHLPNRRLLMEHLDHSIAVTKRDDKQMALLMLDLDKFKQVNDSLGHQAGDELLQQVAKRLSSRLRDVDMVARLGGDEFIVLLDDIKNAEAAGQVAANIVEDLNMPFTLLQNNVVRIGVSIGISMCPHNSDVPETLLEQSDIALYQAKNKGRGRYSYYSGSLASEAQVRTVMEKRLSRAIDQQELRLVYQAQVDTSTNNIIGTEVFLRWKNPIDGLTPLHRFIPIAEESGLILSIGTWVLREACRQGREWLDSGFIPLSIAVNISPLQFKQAEISDLIANILAETGFPAKYLTLEITESALIVNQDYAVEMLNQLHRLGIRLAIDDFGTGYSSLTYLKRFPLDILKIDKRFVAEITNLEDDTEIASTLITMGHTLGYKTLAEGVETQEQLKFLQEVGCDMYQGYLKSRPLSAERFAELVKNQQMLD